jgi:hypothetical protein
MYTYDIITEAGDIVLTVKSEFDTKLCLYDYAAKYIVPILRALEPVHGEPLFWEEA